METIINSNATQTVATIKAAKPRKVQGKAQSLGESIGKATPTAFDAWTTLPQTQASFKGLASQVTLGIKLRAKAKTFADEIKGSRSWDIKTDFAPLSKFVKENTALGDVYGRALVAYVFDSPKYSVARAAMGLTYEPVEGGAAARHVASLVDRTISKMEEIVARLADGKTDVADNAAFAKMVRTQLTTLIGAAKKLK